VDRALAGSVAPISSRSRAIAFSRSSTIVMQGPPDMNPVRLPKNGRARCTW
jgi:hypothetical protein